MRWFRSAAVEEECLKELNQQTFWTPIKQFQIIPFDVTKIVYLFHPNKPVFGPVFSHPLHVKTIHN